MTWCRSSSDRASETRLRLIAGVRWVVFLATTNCEAKWGQGVGKIVCEWTEIFRWRRRRKLEPQSNPSIPGHK